MKLLYCFLISFGILTLSLEVKGNDIEDIINSGGTVIDGLGKEIPKLLPSLEELMHLPIQVLVGLPEVAAIGTIDELCSIYLAHHTIKPRPTPSMDKMSFRLRTPCSEYSYSLSEAENLPNNPHFDITKKVVIFVPGWLVSTDRDYVKKIGEAFACRGGYNFLAFNSSDSINTLYSWSAVNTDEVGRLIALALQKLVKKVPVENIYLVGHSLGAHIVGSAGRYFHKYTGRNLTRITGLDPANPCFKEGETLTGIQRGDAKFIDIIHSNPGGFGKRQPLGDVDFYAGGLAPIKPGCFGTFNVLCSHERAIAFYTETVYPGNENNFLGVRCTSLMKVNDGFCNGSKYPMGIAVPYNLKGNYFLDVNSKSPYGENNDGRVPIPSQCIKC